MWFLFGSLMNLIWVSFIRRPRWRRFFSDVPNARSSHIKVTSRGAGFAFAIALFLPSLSGPFLWPALCALLVSALGLTDDIFSCTAKTRFQLQALLSVLVLLPVLMALSVPLAAKIVLGAFLLFVILASINFYNFADGINGHTALQASIALLCWMWLLGSESFAPGLWALLGGLAFFLWANLYKRWVFMGDAGSTFLGFTLAVVPLYLLKDHTLNAFFQQVLLMIAFSFVIFLDCAAILAVKLWKGLPLSMPHRSHFYQQLSRSPGWNHPRASGYLAVMQGLISTGCVASLKISPWFGFQVLIVGGYYTFCVIRSSLTVGEDLVVYLAKGSNHGRQP